MVKPMKNTLSSGADAEAVAYIQLEMAEASILESVGSQYYYCFIQGDYMRFEQNNKPVSITS